MSMFLVRVVPAMAVVIATSLYLMPVSAAEPTAACPTDDIIIRRLEFEGMVKPLADEDAPTLFRAKGFPFCLSAMPVPVQCEGGKYTFAQYVLPNESDPPAEGLSGILTLPVCLDSGVGGKWKAKLEAAGFQLLNMVPEKLSFEVLLSPMFGMPVARTNSTEMIVETNDAKELRATFVFDLKTIGVRAMLMAGKAPFMVMRIVLKVRGLAGQYTAGTSFSTPDCDAYPNRYFDVRNGQSGCKNAERRILYAIQSRKTAN
ncbi:hypothetical protein [Mesorhizobium sp. ES1-6]|uniref:hypothetical protein n=1 Tax=Mesorhizobium sp. ES1-6 TaxID=2876626 RepID=UPI001CCB6A8B|nr:hypothetical protein [Mesorhizobium sp. ES1-6]MBZ9801081.1 hypothetical protein [Mesorhizobium sp. ES1-6]